MGTGKGTDRVRLLDAKREKTFPKLRDAGYCVTSEEDFHYNCIAYAAGNSDTRWWPPIDGEQVEGVEWPDKAPPEETVEAFVAAYATAGYAPCDTSDPEEGYEKVAIYADADGGPTHAARQIMPTGLWASKLGGWEDIRHKTLQAVECAAYGKAVRFVRRKIQGAFAPQCLPPIEAN